MVFVGLASPAEAQYRAAATTPAFTPCRWVCSRAGSARHAPARGKRLIRKGRGQAADLASGEIPKGPQITVNISTQKVTLLRQWRPDRAGPVSTGVPGHPTPQGVFSVIEKDRFHHSNIYSGAPTPSGAAHHLVGHRDTRAGAGSPPASHGCIRLTHDFAQKLWPTTKLGVRVIVSRHEVEPVEFQHASLFVPKPKPAEPKVATNAVTDGTGVKLRRRLRSPQATRPRSPPSPRSPARPPQSSVAAEPRARRAPRSKPSSRRTSRRPRQRHPLNR
jgi:hypothetical protein